MHRSTRDLIEYLENNNFTDLIFDFDETMCHLKIDWSHWFVGIDELAQELGEDYNKNEHTVHKDIERFITKHGEKARQRINEIFLMCERDFLQNVVDNTKLIEYIQNDNRHIYHIISNNMTETIEKELNRLEILSKFENIIGRDKTHISKPNPEPINQLIENSKNSKDKFLMIGDNPGSDILAADRAGIKSFLISMYL